VSAKYLYPRRMSQRFQCDDEYIYPGIGSNSFRIRTDSLRAVVGLTAVLNTVLFFSRIGGTPVNHDAVTAVLNTVLFFSRIGGTPVNRDGGSSRSKQLFI
jgi:hypothetical protein